MKAREIDGGRRSLAAAALLLLLLGIAVTIRLVALDADPQVPAWTGHLTDEGRWNEFARSIALFGRRLEADAGLAHLTLSPAYQAVNLVVFKLFGPSFVTARAQSALAGALILVAMVAVLHRRVGTLALTTGIVILGFEPLLLSIGRLAIPEIPSALFMLLAFLVLASGPPTARMGFVAGLIAAVALGMKGTSLLLVPALLVVALVLPREVPRGDRLRRAAAFAGAQALLAVAGVALLAGGGVMTFDQLLGAAHRSVVFVKPTDLYTLMRRLFNAPNLEGRNLLFLGVWIGTWAWTHRSAPARTDPVLRTIYLGSAICMGWWLLVFSANDYSPERYVVHFSVPAALNIVAALAPGVTGLGSRVAAGIAARGAGGRALVFGWLSLPVAVFGAPVVAAWLGVAGWQIDRLVEQMGLVVLLVLAQVLALTRMRMDRSERLVGILLALPFWLAGAWLLATELDVVRSFWDIGSGRGLAVWTAVVVACAGLAALAGRVSAPRAVFAPALALLVVGGVWTARSLPAILAPSYVARDAGRDLPTRVAPGTTLHTVAAASLFLANDLGYVDWSLRSRSVRVVVVHEDSARGRAFLASEHGEALDRAHGYDVPVRPGGLRRAVKAPPVPIGVYLAR